MNELLLMNAVDAYININIAGFLNEKKNVHIFKSILLGCYYFILLL